jgi:hypothetical protein
MQPHLLCLLWPVLAAIGPTAVTAAEAGADFDRVRVEFLQKHCLSCHGAQVHKGRLDLHAYHDAASVLKDRKTWERVVNRVRAGEMPPPRRPRPGPGEVDAFVRAVDALLLRGPDPGRVTARRLNRTEYNNTIRDLVGVDFQPAEDFPSDEVGHGFDNVGDVLTVSPLLLERYLSAAESIVQRAIVVGPPPRPARRPVEAQFLRPPPWGGFREKAFRSIEGKGPLSTTYRISRDGEYLLRARAWGRQAGDEPVRLALFLDGKQLHIAAVRAEQGRPGEYTSAPLALHAGRYRASVALLNPFTDPKAAGKEAGTRALYVQDLELEGPLDPYPPSHKRILASAPSRPPRERAREVLTRFASRAYRRPATGDEVDRLLRFVDDATSHDRPWEAGVQLALQAVLVSPKFLFRLELDDVRSGTTARPLDEYQLASRLSYFLWASMPDDELFELAARRALKDNLEAQVRRMLKDPRARSLVEDFAIQWLQLRRLATFAPDGRQFPQFDEKLRAAMLKETELFVGAVFGEDRSVLELIDADFTFVNERLARHYGIADTNGNAAGRKPTRPAGDPIRGERFVRVAVGDSGRGGLLTQASILAVTSNPTRTSPVKRGKWVLEQILGTPPPPPLPDVPPLAETAQAILSGSLRQRMEQHRADARCAVCHARMDALGFAFENYDVLGSFRTQDAGFPVDPSGTLPDGRSFRGPVNLKAILKQDKELFLRCLSEKLLTYALGRGLEYYDRPAVDRIVASAARQGYHFSSLVTAIVQSEPFRLRRGKDARP